MLAQTIRNNLKDINNLKMRTKATKFSSLFQSAPTEIEALGKEFRQVLMKDGLIEVEQDDSLFDEIPEYEEITVLKIVILMRKKLQNILLKIQTKLLWNFRLFQIFSLTKNFRFLNHLV